MCILPNYLKRICCNLLFICFVLFLKMTNKLMILIIFAESFRMHVSLH